MVCLQKTSFKCTVTITAIHEVPRWWYIGCAKCTKALDIETVPFSCPTYEWKETNTLWDIFLGLLETFCSTSLLPTRNHHVVFLFSQPFCSYKLSFEARDDTAEARFFAYNEVSRRIIRRNIDFMLRESRKAPGLPQQLRNLISRKYTFIVGVTTSSFRDPKIRTYLVKAVSFDYLEQAYVAERLLLIQPPRQSEGSSSSVPAGQLTNSSTGLDSQIQAITDIALPTGASVSIAVLLAAMSKPAHTLLATHHLPPTIIYCDCILCMPKDSCPTSICRHLRRLLCLMIHRPRTILISTLLL